jgi:hypothetical protein
VIALLFKLADHPTQLVDYATREDDGREIQHLIVGDWYFSFWLDHPVRTHRSAWRIAGQGSTLIGL